MNILPKLKVFCCGLFVLMLIAGCSNASERSEQAPPTNRPEKTPAAETPAPTAEPAPTEPPAAETKAPEPKLLGYAETKLLDTAAERVHNIRLAAGAIDEHVLAPGKDFSFNRVVGERTPERGYQNAAVIINKEKAEDCGGGVCQVSTTVYQAAEAAGLTILERHSHQKDVGYAGQGSDAAVDYGHLDMQFRNNTGQSVTIKVSVGNGVVAAAVYGEPS